MTGDILRLFEIGVTFVEDGSDCDCGAVDAEDTAVIVDATEADEDWSGDFVVTARFGFVRST